MKARGSLLGQLLVAFKFTPRHGLVTLTAGVEAPTW
jgi:hypothetical protein